MKKILCFAAMLMFISSAAFAVETSYPNGFPGGVNIEGVSILNTYAGNVYWVDSGIGSNGYSGKTKDKPFADIDYAVSKMRANSGDIILVAPGHRENITSDSAIDLDVAGISVVGLGQGSNMPMINYSSTTATFVIGADNVTVMGINFHAEESRIASAVVIEANADYAKVANCKFDVETAGTDEFLNVIQTNNESNYATIEGNYIDMIAGGQSLSAVKLIEDTDGTVIRNNVIFGDYSAANIWGITTKSERLNIDKNVLVNGEGDDINDEPGIELVTASTGVIQNNYIVSNLATKAASVVCTTCMLFENYYNEDASSAGTGGIIGTASADD